MNIDQFLNYLENSLDDSAAVNEILNKYRVVINNAHESFEFTKSKIIYKKQSSAYKNLPSEWLLPEDEISYIVTEYQMIEVIKLVIKNTALNVKNDIHISKDTITIFCKYPKLKQEIETKSLVKKLEEDEIRLEIIKRKNDRVYKEMTNSGARHWYKFFSLSIEEVIKSVCSLQTLELHIDKLYTKAFESESTLNYLYTQKHRDLLEFQQSAEEKYECGSGYYVSYLWLKNDLFDINVRLTVRYSGNHESTAEKITHDIEVYIYQIKEHLLLQDTMRYEEIVDYFDKHL